MAPQDHIKCINEDRLDLRCVVLTEKKRLVQILQHPVNDSIFVENFM